MFVYRTGIKKFKVFLLSKDVKIFNMEVCFTQKLRFFILKDTMFVFSYLLVVVMWAD